MNRCWSIVARAPRRVNGAGEPGGSTAKANCWLKLEANHDGASNSTTVTEAATAVRAAAAEAVQRRSARARQVRSNSSSCTAPGSFVVMEYLKSTSRCLGGSELRLVLPVLIETQDTGYTLICGQTSRSLVIEKQLDESLMTLRDTNATPISFSNLNRQW
jgi:hypothetical protein